MIHLAFLWHMHQPDYRDAFTGEVLLPWVRLHGIKDYWGMASLVADRPPVKAVFNWVPVLVEQLREAASPSGTDRALEVARKPADALTEEEVQYALRAFFRANRERMINPYPRFRALLELRGHDISRLARVARRFRTEDLRDLQVWANLAWFHVTLRETDPVVSALITKGSRFTEDDKAALLARQKELLGQVLGLYKQLQAQGQAELTTTPYCHPILPLLLDMNSALAAMPGAPLPERRGPYADDARDQISAAVRLHEEVFGRRPDGLWPSEGAVSAPAASLAAQAGFSWLATDEGILSRSLGVDLGSAHRMGPRALLYQPYVFHTENGPVNIVFRDREISDRIGFKYQHMSAREAAADLVGYLEHVRRHRPVEDLLVPVILDGENPWEGYARGGVNFLDALYARLAETDWIRMTTVSDFLERCPGRGRLDRLHPGSWIDSNFSVWIGNREDNLAWDRLGETAEDLQRASGNAGPENVAKARRALWSAQGSDWFWWYGDRFSSDEDEDFDGLFRTHLGNVHRFLNQDPPDRLAAPILSHGRKTYSDPVGLLDVRIDGVSTYYFEWSGAGEYDPRRDYTSMGRSDESTLSAIRFGFDLASFFFRTDLLPDAASFLDGNSDIRLHLHEPPRRLFLRREGGGRSGRVWLVDESNDALGDPVPVGTWAADRFLEMAVPFAAIGSAPGKIFRFHVVAIHRGRVLDRYPRGGLFEVKVPDEGFEMEHWIV